MDVLSPSPGESSSVEIAEGAYQATVIPDDEWIAHAKLTREYLNTQLANSSNLSGAQLLEVIRRLKDLAAAMKQFEDAGAGASCGGTVTSDHSGEVTVSAALNGKLSVVCK